jgi:hypothetical protein
MEGSSSRISSLEGALNLSLSSLKNLLIFFIAPYSTSFISPSHQPHPLKALDSQQVAV